MTDDDRQERIDNTVDVDSLTVEMIDPRREAMKKSLTELTIDEVIQYRANEFFSDDERRYPHSMYADSMVHRALRKMCKLHSPMTSTIRYLIIQVGFRKIMESNVGGITGIGNLIESIDDNPLTEGGVDGLPCRSLNQKGGYIKQDKVGFTLADNEMIKETAFAVGMNISSFLVVCFWYGVLSCDRLPDDLKEYGKGIVGQFDQHLLIRQIMLKAISEV